MKMLKTKKMKMAGRGALYAGAFGAGAALRKTRNEQRKDAAFLRSERKKAEK
jgi:hypothetical protein